MNLTKENLKDLSETRLKEARVLYDNGFYDGAKYLIGGEIGLSVFSFSTFFAGIFYLGGFILRLWLGK